MNDKCFSKKAWFVLLTDCSGSKLHLGKKNCIDHMVLRSKVQWNTRYSGSWDWEFSVTEGMKIGVYLLSFTLWDKTHDLLLLLKCLRGPFPKPFQMFP